MSSILSPASSTRSSLDHTQSSAQFTSSNALTSAAARAEAREGRRNRSALRDYYNLASSASASSSTTNVTTVRSDNPQTDETAPSTRSSRQPSLLDPLDNQDFVAAAYLDELLSGSSLEDVLRVQASLAQETRGLDGERKGLVYDNYGRLIGARNVVQGVAQYLLPLGDGTEDSANTANGKEKMDSVKRAVEHLGPKIDALISQPTAHDSQVADNADNEQQRHQRSTVKWLLAAPVRMEELLRNGKHDEAKVLKAEAEALLDQWLEIPGVEDIRTRLNTASQIADPQTTSK